MESRDLWIFKHVAELQSVSKAAEQLGYVQPNVSQRMKFLENELGVKLFMRNNQGVTLTEEGAVLFEYTNRIMRLMDEAKSRINPQKWRETLTIGASQTISAIKIPQLFSFFLREHQHIDVKVRTNRKQRLLEMLSYGEIDGVFLSGTDHFPFETVYSYVEKIVLISPKHHPIEKQKGQALLVHSDPNCIYRRKTLGFTKEHGLKTSSLLEFDSLESILQAVHNGLGISILPADVAYSRKETDTVQYQELPETIKIHFVVPYRKKQSQSLRRFIHFLQSIRVSKL